MGPKNLRDFFECVILFVVTVALLTMFGCGKAHAQVIQPAIPEDQAVRAIIGEAADQGRKGMLAVAEALRKRGTLRGVYGVRAKHVDSQPSWVWKMAREVWEESKTSNITNGADHWHNVRREGETYWTVKMTKTVCIKDHCFYKAKG